MSGYVSIKTLLTKPLSILSLTLSWLTLLLHQVMFCHLSPASPSTASVIMLLKSSIILVFFGWRPSSFSWLNLISLKSSMHSQGLHFPLTILLMVSHVLSVSVHLGLSQIQVISNDWGVLLNVILVSMMFLFLKFICTLNYFLHHSASPRDIPSRYS